MTMNSGTQHFMASLLSQEILGWLLDDHTTSGYVMGADSDTGKPKCTIIALALNGANFINFAKEKGSMVAFVRSQLGDFFKDCNAETVAFIESFTLDDETKIMHYWDKTAQVELSKSKMGELSDAWWNKGRIAQVTQTPLTRIGHDLTDKIKLMSEALTDIKIKEEILVKVIKTEFKKNKKRNAKYDAKSTRKNSRLFEVFEYHHSIQAELWLYEAYEHDPEFTCGDSSMWETGDSGLDGLGVTGESGRVTEASPDRLDWLLDDPVMSIFDDVESQKIFSDYEIQEKLDHDKDASLVMEFAQLTTGQDTLGGRIQVECV